ncbi:hypothetical protein F511_00111 [Dorcoceras hygrometricum]|nr:hypothetical protein F511_00111 [Dorcoceras hygrometricum]
MAIEKDLVPSENNKTDVRSSPSSVVTQQRGEGHDSEFSDDVVAGNEYLHMSDFRSSPVLENPDITNGKKKSVESLNMNPTIIKKVKKPNSIRLFGVGIQGPSTDTGCNKTNSIRIFGVDIHVPTDTITTIRNLCVFLIRKRPISSRSSQYMILPANAQHGVRPVSLCKKKLVEPQRAFHHQKREADEVSDRGEETSRRRRQDIWLDVLATDPWGESHELHLKLWRSLHVVLNGKNWNTVVSKNPLQE